MSSIQLDAARERELAAALFNGVWELLEQENRTSDDDARMLHMAHASCHHWLQVGTAKNFARGEWLCSRVYASLRRPEAAEYHARRVLEICERNGLGDFDLAFAYEALARARAVAGDAAGGRGFTEQALGAAEDITEADDRELLMGDLETIPGLTRFW